jgi:hypothetical protein
MPLPAVNALIAALLLHLSPALAVLAGQAGWHHPAGQADSLSHLVQLPVPWNSFVHSSTPALNCCCCAAISIST